MDTYQRFFVSEYFGLSSARLGMLCRQYSPESESKQAGRLTEILPPPEERGTYHTKVIGVIMDRESISEIVVSPSPDVS